ncbi:MAG TPA: hypothetical protein VJ775_05960 [Sphingomicrobium sp.]|nr:hypothetical protein [Sphingomicrobium sp.]
MIVAACGLTLSGCATTGVAPQTSISSIQPGMKRADVIAALGEPGNRSFRGGAEALQYCRKSSALISDGEEYATVWLQDGAVAGLTTKRQRLDVSSCRAYPAIDWGQVAPDIRVRIE